MVWERLQTGQGLSDFGGLANSLDRPRDSGHRLERSGTRRAMARMPCSSASRRGRDGAVGNYDAPTLMASFGTWKTRTPRS